MKNRISFCTPLVVAFLALFLASSSYAAVNMPHFSLDNVVNGKRVDSSSFVDKVLLVTFFATWCPPCRQEVPVLKKLQNNFEAEGFSVLAFSGDQGGAKTVASFVKKEAINYPVLMATYKASEDFGGVFQIPTSFLVNKEGQIVKKYQGYVPYSVLEKDVLRVLQ